MYQLLCTMNRWISLLEIAVEDSLYRGYRVYMFTKQTLYQNIKTIDLSICTSYYVLWIDE